MQYMLWFCFLYCTLDLVTRIAAGVYAWRQKKQAKLKFYTSIDLFENIFAIEREQKPVNRLPL